VLNLTIVIPTYNRHKYLLRSIHYWSNYDVNVLVIDGGDSKLDQLYLSSLSPNISYHYVPIGFLKRLEIASNLIKTKYCILLGDDEFFIPSALNSAIKALEKDSELVACCGQSVNFWPGKIASWTSKDVVLLSHISYPERKGYLISQNTPYKRMLEHMTDYSPTSIYSVIRTPDWKKVVSIIAKKEFNAYGIFELQFEMAIAYLGKIKVLDELFWLRSAENGNIQGADISLQIENSFESWWVDPDKFTERQEFLQITADGLSDNVNSDADIIKYLEESLKAYLKFSNARQPTSFMNIKNALFFNLSENIQTIIKNIFLYKGLGKKFEDNINCVIRSETKVNIDELLEIKNLILEFHNIKE
jgi:glycosyltransferase domain-containing protein